MSCPAGVLTRQTFAQFACFASRVPRGAYVVTDATSLSYLARLRGQGLSIHWPAWKFRLGDHEGPIMMPWDAAGPGFSSSRNRRIWRYRLDFCQGMNLPPREFVVPYTMSLTILARHLDSRIAANHGVARDLADLVPPP